MFAQDVQLWLGALDGELVLQLACLADAGDEEPSRLKIVYHLVIVFLL